MKSEYFNRKEAAVYLNMSPHTLDQWRSEKAHLTYYKIGGAVRYKKSDLDEYMASHRITIK